MDSAVGRGLLASMVTVPVAFVWIWMTELFMDDAPGADTVIRICAKTVLAALVAGTLAALAAMPAASRVAGITTALAAHLTVLGLCLLVDAPSLGSDPSTIFFGGYDFSVGDVRTIGATAVVLAGFLALVTWRLARRS